MTKVISFVSRKGGTGKTTNAINLATSLCQLRKKVLVIETDINYTLSSLRTNELAKTGLVTKNHPDIITTEETSVVKEINTHINGADYDYIIIDSAGNTTEYGTNRLCVSSDLVIIPTSLSSNDLMVAKQTMEYVIPAMEENDNLKVVIMPTRIHSRTKLENVINALSHLNAEILRIFVPSKKIFTRVSTVKSTEGFQDITKEILKLL